VIELMKGHIGQPPGGWPKKIQKRILKDELPITERPGALLPEEDIEARRAEIAEATGEEIDDEDLAGYLMYPKVFKDYALRHAEYGPVRTLDTATYFYGMQAGEEISPEIDPGKILEIRMQAVGDTNAEGEVRVFFELNGQPRTVRVPNRKIKGTTAVRPKAEPGNPAHVGAPMPGAVASVPVQAGAKVSEGDLLVTIEAMKMETGLHAERDAVVKAVHVRPGDQIDAKDLLVELE
jgi:pyruvate carboxylase